MTNNISTCPAVYQSRTGGTVDSPTGLFFITAGEVAFLALLLFGLVLYVLVTLPFGGDSPIDRVRLK